MNYSFLSLFIKNQFKSSYFNYPKTLFNQNIFFYKLKSYNFFNSFIFSNSQNQNLNFKYSIFKNFLSSSIKINSLSYNSMFFNFYGPSIEHIDQITISFCVFENCFSNKNGGCLEINKGEKLNSYVHIFQTFFQNCSCLKSGGAIYIHLRNWTIADCCFQFCQSLESSCIYAASIPSESYFNGTTLINNGLLNEEILLMQLQSNNLYINDCNFSFNKIGEYGFGGGFGTYLDLKLNYLTFFENIGKSGLHINSKKGDCILDYFNIINNSFKGEWVGLVHLGSPSEISNWIIIGCSFPFFILTQQAYGSIFSDCIFDATFNSPIFIGQCTTAHIKFKKAENTLKFSYIYQDNCKNFIESQNINGNIKNDKDRNRFILILIIIIIFLIISLFLLFKKPNLNQNGENIPFSGSIKRKPVIPINRNI